MSQYSRKAGFTVFFAILVGSLALAIGLSIYELLVRELELSQVARESQFAIYAADAGAECAMYWDSRCTTGTNPSCVCTAWDSGGTCILGTAFASTSNAGGNFTIPPNPSSGIRCTAINTTDHDIAAFGWPVSSPFGINDSPDLTNVGLPAAGTWEHWEETYSSATPVVNATTTFIILLGNSVRSPCAKVQVGKFVPDTTIPAKPSRTLIISRGYNTCVTGGLRVERAFQVSY